MQKSGDRRKIPRNKKMCFVAECGTYTYYQSILRLRQEDFEFVAGWATT